MNYLLDTHFLLWYFLAPSKIPSKIVDIFLNDEAQLFYSPISLWEISLKFGKGKLVFDGFSPEDFYNVIQESKLLCSPILNEDFIGSYQLPNFYLDPFDRFLCWHAIQKEYTFISVDTKLHLYKTTGLKLISLDS